MLTFWLMFVITSFQLLDLPFCRFGSELAYAPHIINLVGDPMVMYTSNGSNAVDFRLWATDLVGQNVTAGTLVVTFCGVLAL